MNVLMLATLEEAQAPCRRSPLSHRPHIWQAVSRDLGARFQEAPVLYCPYDLMFLSEQAASALRLSLSTTDPWPDPAPVQGPSGPQGPTGPVGPEGPKGDAGPTGTTGPQGPAGATGAAGAPGVAGSTGATGAVGPAGPQGPQGPAGTTLPIGTIILATTTATLPTGWHVADGTGGTQNIKAPQAGVNYVQRVS